MEFTEEQQVLQQVINEAWENEAFKAELMTNPMEAIEQLTGKKIQLPEGKELIVRDQTSENSIYINIPSVTTEGDDVELSEEQLENVAGGVYVHGNCHEEPGTTKPTNPFEIITIIK